MFGLCGIQQVSHKCLWNDVCVQGGLGCHPVLASLPMRSPEIPSDVLSWPTPSLYPLPFILFTLTKAFVLGFRWSRRWTGRRRVMSWSGKLCSFRLGLCCVLGWALEEGGERMHVL